MASASSSALPQVQVNGAAPVDEAVWQDNGADDENLTWRCRAAVLVEYNQPLQIKEIEVGPLRDGECLVQVVAGKLSRCRVARRRKGPQKPYEMKCLGFLPRVPNSPHAP